MICGYGQGRYTQAHTYPHTQAHTYPHTQAPTLTFTLTPTQAPTQAPTLRRVCNPPPSVAGSATRGKENDATLGGAAFLRHKPFMKGLTRVANPQQKAGGLQTRLNVEGSWETRGRLVEGTWETRGKHVKGTWKIRGRYVEGTWKIRGRHVEDTWETRGKHVGNACT